MEKKVSGHLEKKLDALVAKALKEHVFTACSVGFFMKNKEEGSRRDIFNYGFTDQGDNGYPVEDGTIFDLASLTKPLVTALSVLALMEEGRVNLDDRLQTYFDLGSADKRNITLFQLLTHSSGLPAHRPFFKKLITLPDDERKNSIVNWIFAEDLVFRPGTNQLYSDLGFILLGRIVEMASGESLAGYWRRKIVIPLHLEHGLFFASQGGMDGRKCAVTGNCSWSKRRLCGVVHDDNCRALGGVAGHAGLFGTCDALVSLCEIMIGQFQGDKIQEAHSLGNLRRVLLAGQGPWRFGFDTPTPGTSSSGRYFSEPSLGHLGFTGTSFWIDPQQGIGVVLLTNRVLCGENLIPIKKLRPLVHDTIMEFLIKKSG